LNNNVAEVTYVSQVTATAAELHRFLSNPIHSMLEKSLQHYFTGDNSALTTGKHSNSSAAYYQYYTTLPCTPPQKR